MDDQRNTGVDQPGPNGETFGEDAASGVQTESGQEVRHRQLDELTQAYERARDEMNEALRSLRAEIAKIDLDQATARARTWVDENPTLAVFLGIGAGVLTGKLMSGAFRSEPPPLSSRARKQADQLAGQAGSFANEIGAALAYHLGRAARSAGEAGDLVAHRSSDIAETVSRRAREVGEDVSRRAERAGKGFSRRASHVGHDVSRKAEHAVETIADTASHSVHALEDAAHDLSKTLKKRSKKIRKKAKKSGAGDFPETALNAARTIVAAVAVKKVNDWIKQMR